MTARVLNRLLQLEQRGQVSDGAGGFIEVWTALGALWADVAPRSGRETGGGDVALGTVTYRIVVRGAPPGAPSRPRPGQRFREGGRVFLIRAVTEAMPDGRFLTCFADEEVAS